MKTKITFPYVVYDIETTGLERTLDAIIEIGAIRVEGDKRTTFETMIKPRIPISAGAFEANGISDEEAQSKGADPAFAFRNFLKFVGDLPLVAHNGMCFDHPLVAHELERIKIERPQNILLDTQILAGHFLGFPRGKQSREHICTTLGIEMEKSHRAMSDTKDCLEIFQRVLQKNADMETLWTLCHGYILSNVTAVPEGMELLQIAIAEQKDLCMSYQGEKDAAPVERWIKPYGVEPSKKLFPSVRSLCLKDSKPKNFRLDRIKKLVRVR